MSCFSGGKDTVKERQQGTMECSVELLDDTVCKVKLKNVSKGVLLMNEVCSHLNLLEKDYFGLRFLDNSKTSHWLDLQKGLLKQIKRHGLKPSPVKFYFSVKFYATDPCKLREEVTRYQFFLQLKRDVLIGRIPVAFDNLVEVCSLAVQSELGDYDPTVHTSGYVSELRLAPQQSEDLEQAIAVSHQKLIGFHPSTCEYMYLDKMKWQEMYGVDLHLVKGAGNTEYCIGLTPSGVVIYRQKTKVSIYYWPRISGINFKSKKFSLKVRDKKGLETSYYFAFDTKESCKSLWKCCIEHHTFFRMSQADVQASIINDFFQLGSKFRYSGRTEKEIANSEPVRSPQPVKRTKSQRQERRQTKTENISSRKQAITSAQVIAKSHADVAKTMLASNGGIASHQPPLSIPVRPMNHRMDKSLNHHNSSQLTGVPSTNLDLSWISQGGLFTSGRDSPKSVRSDKMKFPSKLGRNDSGSEADSAYTKRSRTVDSPEDGKSQFSFHHYHGYNRRESDNESERSALSRRRRRRYQRGNESGSDAESVHRRKRRTEHARGYRHDDSFREGSTCSGMSTPKSEMVYPRSSRYSRDGMNKRNISEELNKHFHTKLLDNVGLTEEQLKDIKYISVNVSNPADDHKSASLYEKLSAIQQPFSKSHAGIIQTTDSSPPPIVPRTPSSSSYENVLYNHSGSARLVSDEELSTHNYSHTGDYAVILPPENFDSQTLKPSANKKLFTHTEAPRKETRQPSSQISSSEYAKSNNSTLKQSTNTYSDRGLPYTHKITYSADSTVGGTLKHSNNTLIDRRYPYAHEMVSSQPRSYPHLTAFTPIPVKSCNGNQGMTQSSSVKPEGHWVKPANAYKHTDHQTTARVVETNTLASCQPHSPAHQRSITAQQNNHANLQNSTQQQNLTYKQSSPSALLNGNLSVGVEHKPTPRHQTPNGVNNHADDSFYAQYCVRKGMKTPGNGLIITNNAPYKPLLKVSNI